MPFFPASQRTPHVLEATKTSCSPDKKNWSQTIYLSLSLSLIILFTNVQNKNIYKSTIGKGKQ